MVELKINCLGSYGGFTRLEPTEQTINNVYAGDKNVFCIFCGDKLVWAQTRIFGLTKNSESYKGNGSWIYIIRKEEGTDYYLYYTDSVYRTFSYDAEVITFNSYKGSFQSHNAFSSCSNLEEVRFYQPDTEIIEKMYMSFSNCKKLRIIDFSNIKEGIGHITGYLDTPYFGLTFLNCNSLKEIRGLEHIKFTETSNVTKEERSLQQTFANCWVLENEINLSEIIKFDISNLLYTFTNCYKIPKIIIGQATPSSMRGCFSNCNSLEYLDISQVDTTNCNDGNGFIDVFGGCTSLSELYISSLFFNRPNGTTYSFGNCPLNRDSIYRFLTAINGSTHYGYIEIKEEVFNIINTDSELSGIADEILDKNWEFTTY